MIPVNTPLIHTLHIRGDVYVWHVYVEHVIEAVKFFMTAEYSTWHLYN